VMTMEYFVHSGNGLDDPELIAVTETADQARDAAAIETDKWPDQIVTICDRLGYALEI